MAGGRLSVFSPLRRGASAPLAKIDVDRGTVGGGFFAGAPSDYFRNWNQCWRMFARSSSHKALRCCSVNKASARRPVKAARKVSENEAKSLADAPI
jgi:hypothetical protein